MSAAAGSGTKSLEQRWLRIVSGEARDVGSCLGRWGLAVASGLYWLGLRANLGVYDWRLKSKTRAPLPVLSVGNLTLGGTGKTTAVRYLARLMSEAGVPVGIALRGHGRRSTGCLVANDGQGHRLPAAAAGDEATEYGRLLPTTPLALGKRREISLALLKDLGARVGLLDDGLQYFRMEHDWEIVLVSALSDPRVCHLFPRGILREPWAHLCRADQVWLTHSDQVGPERLDALRGLVSAHAPGAAVVLTRHAPEELVAWPGGESRDLAELAGQRVVAVSALGSPLSFEGSLAACGAEVVPLRFPDHHSYAAGDWAAAAETARQMGAAWLVTTEKDAAKIHGELPWPTLVLRSELAVVAGGDYVRELVSQVRETLGDL